MNSITGSMIPVLLGLSAFAQTQIFLPNQTRQVDFGSAPSTRPAKTGAALPPICKVGDLFFKTDAAAGNNLYGCSAVNTWTLQGGGGPSGGTNSTDLAPSVSAGLLSVQPGRIRFGASPCMNFNSVSTAFVNAGNTASATAKLYATDSCALVLEYPSSVPLSFTLNGITAAAVEMPAVPATALDLADVTITQGSITAVSDKRATISTFSALAGSGMVVDCTAGPCLFSIDPATVAQTAGTNLLTGIQDARLAVQTFPSRHAATDPSACTVGEQYFNTSTSSRRDCTATNIWTSPAGSSPTVTDNITVAAAGSGTGGTPVSFWSWATAGPSGGIDCVLLCGVDFGHGGSVEQQAVFGLRMHSAWTGSVSLTLATFSHSGTGGNALMKAYTACPSSFLNPVWNTASTQAVSYSGLAGDAVTVTFTGLNVTGCAPGSNMLLRVGRDGANAADTFSGFVHVNSAAMIATHN